MFFFFRTLFKRRIASPTPTINCCCFSAHPVSSMSVFTLSIVVLVYICVTRDGITWADNVNIINNGSSTLFLLATKTSISLYRPSNHSKLVLVSDLIKATRVSFDNEHQTVYWTDTLENKVYSLSINKPDVVEIASRGIGSLSGIAVDFIGRYLYWVDGQYSRIEVSGLDGSMRTTLLDGIEHSSGLKTDSFEGLLFWTTRCDQSQCIERSWTDGSGRKTIYSAESIGAIAVDIYTKKIYWINIRNVSVDKSNYDGSSHEVIYSNALLSSASSLAIRKGAIYWVDGKTHVLMSVNEENEAAIERLTISRPALYDIEIVLNGEEFVDRRVLPCSVRNGGCSHLCLRGDHFNYTCLCPYSLKIGHDMKTCRHHGSVLGYASRERHHHNVFFVDWEEPQTWVFPPLKIPVQNVVGFAADPSKDAIFWIDGTKIQHQLLTGQTETILELDYMTPYSLSLDWKSRNLYLLSSLDNSSLISVCKANGDFLTHLVWLDMHQPRQILVDSENRLLFWLHEKINGEFLLEFSNLDGSGRHVFIETRSKIQSFVADVFGDQLCWLLDGDTRIRCRSYFSEETRTLTPTQSKISVMCSYNGNLLYADHLGALKSLNMSLDRRKAISINTSHSLCFLTVMDPKRTLANYYQSSDNLAKSLCIEKKSKEYVCQYEKASPYLMYISSGQPHSISLEDPTFPDLFPGPIFTSFGSLDVFVTETTEIFYTVANGNKVQSTRRDNNKKKLVFKSEYEIGGIAIDAISRNLYWSHPSKGQIWVSRLSGQHPYVVINDPLVKPTQLVIGSGFLAWSSCLEQCQIKLSSLSGQNEAILATNISSIGDLIIIGGSLYYSNPKRGSIEEIDLHSRTRRTIVSSGKPISIGIYNKTIYWIESESVFKQSLTSPTAEPILIRSGVNMSGILIAGGEETAVASNPCHLNNGGCSQLCLSSNSQNNCFCSHSYLVNSTQCQNFESYLLATSGSLILSFTSPSPNSPTPTLTPNSNLTNLAALTFDPYNDRLVFSDLYRSPYLFSVFRNGTGFRAQLERHLGLKTIEGLTYDPVRKILLWTESISPSIWGQSKLNEASEYFLLDKSDKPRGIAMHSCSGRVFWTNWKKAQPKIQTGFLGTSRVDTFLTQGLARPEALAIYADTIYWGNSQEQSFSIESCHLETMRRKVLFRGSHRTPFTLVPFDHSLFWTDRENNVICQTDSTTNESCKIIRINSEHTLGMALIGAPPISCQEFGKISATASLPLLVDENQGCGEDHCSHHNPFNSNSMNAIRRALYCSLFVVTSAAIMILVYFLRKKQISGQQRKKLNLEQNNTIKRVAVTDQCIREQILKTAKINPSFEMDDVLCGSNSIHLDEGNSLISA